MSKRILLMFLLILIKVNVVFSFQPIEPKVVVGGDGINGQYGAHLLVLKPDGKLWSWGRNNDGQVGDGTNIDKNLPVLIDGQSRWKDVAAGWGHTVAVKSDGTLWGWGDNSFGQLGLGNDYYSVNLPTQIGNDNNWVEVYAGGYFTIAKKADGSLWAFGDGASGQLGNGLFTSSRVPVQVTVPIGVSFVKVSTGFDHVLAISSNGELYAWGGNLYGQIGDGNSGNDKDVGTPKQVGSETDWAIVVAGWQFSYGVKNNGKLYVWGHNTGALGMDAGIALLTPTLNPNLPALDLSSLRTVVSAGLYNGVALNAGRLWIWGLNDLGQLGNGNAPNGSLSPINIDTEPGWLTIAVSGKNVIGIKTTTQTSLDYTLWTWGDNQSGQIGDGTNDTFKQIPTQIGYPDVYIEPSQKDFGTIQLGQTSIEEVFALYNTGFRSLNITNLSVTGQSSDFIINSNCLDNPISQLSQCNIQIKFNPAFAGIRSAYISVDSDASLDAEFLVVSGIGKALVNVSISPNNDYGFVLGDGINCPSSICNKEYTNENLTLTAYNSSPGTYFTHWSGDINSSQNPISLTLDSNKNIIANFAIYTYTVNINVGLNGTVSPNTTQIVNYGDRIVFTITPNQGYKISSISGCSGTLNNNYFTTTPITADCTLNVIFEQETFLINTFTFPSGTGEISCTPNSVPYNSISTCTIIPNTGYHVESVGGTCGGTLSGNTYTTNAITSACTVEANFALNTYTLTINKTGTGSGVVTSNPAGIGCGSDCNETYTHGTLVTLTAVPDTGSIFTGWSGDCTGSSGSVQVTMDKTKTCTATFTLNKYTVAVNADGNGIGSISSNPSGISYNYPANNAGSGSFDHGSTITLTATASVGSTVSWKGTCTLAGGTEAGNGTQTATCTFANLTSAKTATVTFTLNQYTITVNAVGNGSGSISSSPAGISYNYPTNNTGSGNFNHGSTVVLTAAANTGSTVSWTNCNESIAGNGTQTATCTFSNLTAAKTAEVEFKLNQYNIITSTNSSDGGSILCTPSSVLHGSTSTCTITPNTGYHVESVGGTCGGTLSGNTYTTNSITADCTIQVNFTLNQYTITTSVNSIAGGNVSCTPNPVDHGSTSTCTITPNTGYHIETVTGTCGGTLSGNIYTTNAITGNCTVQANFTLNQYAVTANAGGNGSGSISSNPVGINYNYPSSNTGSGSFDHGSNVVLTATASVGSTVSWKGTCTSAGGTESGNGTQTATCTFTNLTSAKTATATFTLNQYTITASANPTTGGSITCTPNPVDHGSTSTCTITPNTGYHIETVTCTCGGTLSGNTYTTNAITSACTVIANLAINTYTLTINKTGTGSGVVTSNPAGITCGSDCNETYTHGTQITLTAVSDPDSEFESWTGDCSGNNSTTTIAIDGNKTCTANFRKVVTINNSSKYTTNASVTLTLDPVGTPTKMTIYNGKVWSPEENYTSQKTITIPGGDGRKDIYVRLLIDGIWKEYKDYIYLDVKAPVGSVQINGGAPVTNTLTVTLNLFVADYQDTGDIEMNISEDKINWTGWISFQPTYNYTFTNTQEGTKTIYVQYKDSGGKTSPIYSDNIIYKTSISTVQSSNITINNGASYTNKTGVTLSITNPDTNTYTLMSFSQDLTKWTGWETYKATRTLSLTGQDGEKWVYVRFTDNTKTATSEIYGDSIILDRKKPVGTIQINGGAYITKYPDVQLSIHATDELSGIDYIEISNDNVNWTNIGNVDTANATLTEGDGIKKIYMKIHDKAGNISATIIDTIILDTKAPVGKISISKLTTTPEPYDVKLTLSAPGSVWMKISIDGGNTYSDWESYKTVKILTLQEGENTISVIFKDLVDNTSDPVTAIITLP